MRCFSLKNSMSNPVSGLRALPAALLAAALLSPFAVQAESTTLETVVLTAQRQPQRLSDALAQITVIDREDIEAHAGRSLAELLSDQPGVQFWSNGGAGKAATVSLRGMEARHTLLLIDGVRYGSATLGTPTWENLPLDAIERIEIVRGPLSALYGSDAVGGVVQIFTRKAGAGLHPYGRAAVGEHGQRQAAAGLGFGSGAFDAALGVQWQRDHGFSSTNAHAQFGNHNPDRDGFKQHGVNGRVGFKFGRDWRIDASGLDSRGENQLDDGPGADARSKLHSQVLNLQIGGSVVGSWKTLLRLSRSQDEYETVATASPFTDLGVIGTTQKQIAWENSLLTPVGQLLLVTERLEQDVTRPVSPFSVSDRQVNGVALGLNGQADGHHWQVAARRDRNSQFGSENTGSIGYARDINTNLRAGASFGTSFVAPSFNQLYFPNFGSPTLQPEHGIHREFNLRWTEGAHQVQAVYFNNRIRGYIPSGPQPANVPRTEIEGVSLSYQGHWEGWSVDASVDALDPVNRATGKQLPRRARELMRLGVERSVGDWSFGASIRHAGESFDNSANTPSLRNGSYSVLDLRAAWRPARDWAIGLKLNNARDTVYETVYGFNQPRREWLLTLRYGAV